MELVKYNNPSLKIKQEPYTFIGGESDFSKELYEFMVQSKAMMLPATYAGWHIRMFILDTYPEIIAMYNPKLVDVSEEHVILDEMDVLYPGITVKIKRPKHIRLRFTNPANVVETRKFTGMTARLIQQGIDILDGLPFYAKANFVHRQKLLNKIKIMDRKG